MDELKVWVLLVRVLLVSSTILEKSTLKNWPELNFHLSTLFSSARSWLENACSVSLSSAISGSSIERKQIAWLIAIELLLMFTVMLLLIALWRSAGIICLLFQTTGIKVEKQLFLYVNKVKTKRLFAGNLAAQHE